MSERRPESPRVTRGVKQTRPSLEGMEARILLANAGVTPTGQVLQPLKAYLPPGTIAPRPGRPTLSVDTHQAINRELFRVLGPGMDRLTRAVELFGTSDNSAVAQRVLSNPFFQAVLSRNDTYTLLRTRGVTELVNANPQSSQIPAVVVVAQPPSIIGDPNNANLREVTLPTGEIIAVPVQGNPVQVASGTRIIRIDPNTLAPGDRDALLRFASNSTNGVNSDVFGNIGRDTLLALETAVHTQAPNAADNVPGLRLVQALQNNKNYPDFAKTPYARYLRLAANKRLFSINDTQLTSVQERVTQFFNTVDLLYQTNQIPTEGVFNSPDQPPVNLVTGPLSGTLQVSFGALRELFLDNTNGPNFEPAISGLTLPTIPNLPATADTPQILGFPGKYDAGYIFDKQGNFGLYLSVRNTMSNTVPGQQEANKIQGDISVEVSNAGSINDLNGLRNVEALSMGSALAGGIIASNSNGVATFGSSVGYGAGLEFGTGVRFTTVIPLGNVLSPRFR